MSMGFLIAASALLAVALGVVCWPLWRKATSPRATALALLLVCATPLAAAALYRAFSNHDWNPPSAAGMEPAAMVARLARRLERSPDDKDGWLLLGRSYVVLEQFPQAVRAFQRADRLAGGQDVEALLGWAEALFRGNEAELDGRAGRLFERALELAPDSGKALLFGAIAAQRRGEWVLARDRFVKVLASQPPQELRGAIEAQIAQLNLMAGAPAPGAKSAAADVALVRVRVRLAPALARQSYGDAPLFVLARRAGQGGPPLAVKKLSARFPQEVDLAAGDAMLASTQLQAGEPVEVVARIALSGSPAAAAGDPFGSIRYKVGADRRADITIDQVSPPR